jgi:phosphomannomutase
MVEGVLAGPGLYFHYKFGAMIEITGSHVPEDYIENSNTSIRALTLKV